ncbi:MAG: metallophosphoesterase [Promethearchaeota archaeon]
MLKVILTGDWHINSKKCDYSSLEKAIKQYFNNADIILHTGDLTDGRKVYDGQDYELEYLRLDDMLELTGNILSQIKKDIYIINGNHDYSLIKKFGFDLISVLSDELPNLHLLGNYVGDVKIENYNFRLLHPKGNAYTISYTAQKYVRELRAREILNLDFLLVGHLHRYFVFNIQGLDVIGTMTFQRLTDYAKRRGYGEDIGFVMLNLYKNSYNIKVVHYD